MALSYLEFKAAVSRLCGIDLSLYKSQQMDRRIHSLMPLWGLDSYDEYLALLQSDQRKFQEFLNKLTINVSEFFRNPERFIELWQVILPQLLKEREHLSIWSAGSSNGAEPYSVAIILREMGVLSRSRILGTDIDENILARAETGVYVQNEVKSLPSELLEKYFKVLDGQYYLAESIKKAVTFRKQDLLLDDFGVDYDLIICRNVVIYFTERAKNHLYSKFYHSLRSGGCLWVGGTEPLLNYKVFGFENISASFYKKV